MNPDLRTVTIARDIAEEAAATAYDALSVDIAELRQHVLELQREMRALRRGVLAELERLWETAYGKVASQRSILAQAK